MGYKENQARTVRNFSVPMIVWDMVGLTGIGLLFWALMLLGVVVGGR